MHDAFHCKRLDDAHVLFRGQLPPTVRTDAALFEALWGMHPAERHEIRMVGRAVRIPRWQQAFERDYKFAGGVAAALPVPALLERFLDWSRAAVDARLNGLLVNWYDAAHRHYIGRHRDSPDGLVEGSPIVTISLGAERLFRLRPWKGPGPHDFAAADRAVFVVPYATNRAWTHEVPHRAIDAGRRISITLRAFAEPRTRRP